jgi:hypothetical protein
MSTASKPANMLFRRIMALPISAQALDSRFRGSDQSLDSMSRLLNLLFTIQRFAFMLTAYCLLPTARCCPLADPKSVAHSG